MSKSILGLQICSHMQHVEEASLHFKDFGSIILLGLLDLSKTFLNISVDNSENSKLAVIWPLFVNVAQN